MKRRACFLGLVLALAALVSAGCGGGEPIIEPEEPTEPLATATAMPARPTPLPTPIVEKRIAEMEWPASMRVGDGEVIRLSIAPASGKALLVTPEIAGHEVATATVPLPVTRAGFAGYLNASLTAAGLEVASAGPSRQRLVPDRSVTWRWTISASRAGTYRPVINLTVLWEPQPDVDAPGPIEEEVWSRVLTVRAHAPLGLSGAQVDWLGLGGTVLGTAAGLPFVEKVFSTLWRRLRRRSRETTFGG